MRVYPSKPTFFAHQGNLPVSSHGVPLELKWQQSFTRLDTTGTVHLLCCLACSATHGTVKRTNTNYGNKFDSENLALGSRVPPIEPACSLWNRGSNLSRYTYIHPTLGHRYNRVITVGIRPCQHGTLCCSDWLLRLKDSEGLPRASWKRRHPSSQPLLGCSYA